MCILLVLDRFLCVRVCVCMCLCVCVEVLMGEEYYQVKEYEKALV